MNFFKKRSSTIVIIFILLLAAFMRLYRIGEYMTFLGDEGRDLLAVLEILRGNIIFLGPRSSAADFYYGPVYFYMITPFLWLFNYDPVGPAVFIALVGIATVYLVYHVGKKLFNEPAGLFAAALYAVSPVVLTYSRSSWNPNPMPFVALLTLYTAYCALQKKSMRLFIAVGFLLGIAIQLQYLALFLDVIVFLYLLVVFLLTEKLKDVFQLVKQYALVGLGFLIGWSPFLAFELKHGFPNLKTMSGFILSGNTDKVYPSGMGFNQNVTSVFFKLFGRLVTRFPPPEQVNVNEHVDLWWWQFGTYILGFLSLAALVVYFIYHRKEVFSEKLKQVKKSLSVHEVRDVRLIVPLFSLWILVGCFLFGFYKKEIYDYYLGFMFPLPFLLTGLLLGLLFVRKRFSWLGKIGASLLFIILFLFNIAGNPFQYFPNHQKDQAKLIADFVLSKTQGKPYNFALITKGNSDHEFRYFFEIKNRPPVTILNTDIDPKRTSVTDQLLVVCDYPDCQPRGNSLWEVAGFGQAEIDGEWNVSVVKIFHLVHYKGK